MPEEEFYGLLKMCDAFDLVWLEEGFAKEAAAALAEHPLVTESELRPLEPGRPYSEIEARTCAGEFDKAKALPLSLRNGRIIVCISQAHEQDASLTPDVLLDHL
ncbi:MAG: glycine reductase, partial [Planctomycetes bacterium]|nr:glycine reductase [Planctomycetota bacterium]